MQVSAALKGRKIGTFCSQKFWSSSSVGPCCRPFAWPLAWLIGVAWHPDKREREKAFQSQLFGQTGGCSAGATIATAVPFGSRENCIGKIQSGED